MASPPIKPKSPVKPTRAKAAKPEVSPIAPHLQALLNPGLAERQAGFEEAAQAAYDPGSVTGIDEELAEKLELRGPGGVSATMESLEQLLKLGDPNLREKKPWTPHRPERPQKSEGGVKFDLVSDY